MNGFIRIARRNAARVRTDPGARPPPVALDDPSTRLPPIAGDAGRIGRPAGWRDPFRGG